MNSGRTLRVASTRGIEALLGRFGLELAPLLAEAGLPPDCYRDPETRVPVDRLLHLVALGAERSDCPHFCLLLAEPVQPAVVWRTLSILSCRSP